tara:strand:+ start:1664 stop:1825 length:162 start_codon:yes stop_codon:yes gene_type:complete
MELKKLADVLLLIITILIIVYNILTTLGTECFDKFSMVLSLFAIGYTIFLRIL